MAGESTCSAEGNRCTVSLILPARNEAGNIGPAVGAVHAILQGCAIDGFEVVVVDDGSADGTAAEAEQMLRDLDCGFVVRLPQSRGKGGAIGAGFAASHGDFVGFIDADLEYPPSILPQMVAAMQGRPCCTVAARRRDQRNLMERVTSRAARSVATALLRLGVDDTQAGLKMFPGRFAREYLTDPRQRGWLFDMEALILAVRMNIPIVQFPVTQGRVRPRRVTPGKMLALAPEFARLVTLRWSPGRSTDFAASPQPLSLDTGREGGSR